jgi:hypothetical protein
MCRSSGSDSRGGLPGSSQRRDPARWLTRISTWSTPRFTVHCSADAEATDGTQSTKSVEPREFGIEPNLMPLRRARVACSRTCLESATSRRVFASGYAKPH